MPPELPPDEPPRDPRPPRERAPLDERDDVLRAPPLRGLAAPLAPAELREEVDRLASVPELLARVEVDFFAVPPVLREPVLLADEAREAVALRPPLLPLLLREDPDEDLLDPLDDDPSSPVHLPDITRCAASATASAMIEPSLVALDIMLLAA